MICVFFYLARVDVATRKVWAWWAMIDEIA